MALHVQLIIRNGRQFAGSLSPYYLKIEKVGERDVDFAQLLQAFVTPSIVLDELLQNITPPVKHSASVRLDPDLLYARVSPTVVGLYYRLTALRRHKSTEVLAVARGYCGNCRN